MAKLTISAKCSDLCFCRYKDDSETHVHDGYVPTGIGIGGCGDYLEMVIDTETGQIEGWKPLKKSQILKAFKEAE